MQFSIEKDIDEFIRFLEAAINSNVNIPQEKKIEIINAISIYLNHSKRRKQEIPVIRLFTDNNNYQIL
jgi:low affinity Fe/Cu permease